jgi:type VI secretion system protein ImpH
VAAALAGPVRRAPAPSAPVPTFKGREPYPCDFNSLVRLIECSYRDLPRLGVSQRPAEDAVRFCQEPSLAFPPTTISDFKSHPSARAGRVFVNFLGLLGPNGPMPLQFTDFARDRERNHADPTLARFLDVFNHRMVTLFYRAWSTAQLTTNFDRTEWTERGAPPTPPTPAEGQPADAQGESGEGAGGAWSNEDRYAMYVGALVGIGQRSLRHRDDAPDVAKLFYSGRLAAGVKNAEGLRALLEDYFRVPTRVDEFVGSWLELPERYWCRLGESKQSGLLGVNTIAGSKAWDRQSRFRIVMGPMDLDDYERLLPGGDTQKRLEAWVRNYIGFELAWDVQLVLRESEVPRAALGKGARLGWTTWTTSGALGRDADDLVIQRA